VNLSAVSRKNMEALALSGAFDGFPEIRRSQFFAEDAAKVQFLEYLVRYGSKFQTDKSTVQNSLFGGGNFIGVIRPEIPQAGDWSMLEKLNREKELVGIYISAHPLDSYKLEIDSFCGNKLSELKNLADLNGKDISFAGIITEVRNGTTKTGKPYGSVTIEDYSDSYKLMFFSNDFLEFNKYFTVGYSLLFKAKVLPRPYGDAQLEIKVKSIIMLANVREELVKSISIVVPVQSVTDELITELKAHTDNGKGKVELKFKVIDRKDNISIDMYSRLQRINLSEELIAYLKQRDEIEFRLS
jgi:DNA polymerase III subunit alpha